MATARYRNCEIKFTDDDVVNFDNYDYADKVYILHDHGFVLAVVLEDNLEDAINVAVDEGKLDKFLIDITNDRDDYLTKDFAERAEGLGDEPEVVIDGVKYWWLVEPAFLGNASEPFDIDTLGYVAFPKPKMSLSRLCGETIEAGEGHFS